MMKKISNAVIPAVLMMALVLQSSYIKAESGEELFGSLRCGICHKVNEGKANPSLTEIGKAYNGSETGLINYLQGESEPIVNKGRASVMERPVEKTKALSLEDIKSLAEYILKAGG